MRQNKKIVFQLILKLKTSNETIC